MPSFVSDSTSVPTATAVLLVDVTDFDREVVITATGPNVNWRVAFASGDASTGASIKVNLGDVPFRLILPAGEAFYGYQDGTSTDSLIEFIVTKSIIT